MVSRQGRARRARRALARAARSRELALGRRVDRRRPGEGRAPAVGRAHLHVPPIWWRARLTAGAARPGLRIAALLSLAAQYRSDQASFVVRAGSAADDPAHGMITDLAAAREGPLSLELLEGAPPPAPAPRTRGKAESARYGR